VSSLSTLDRQKVMESVTAAFAETGFEAMGMETLEACTGVDRTTLQEVFGSKRDVLDAALTHYAETFVGPRVSPMEEPEAGVDAVIGFFTGLATFFRGEPTAQRGCLMVNVIAELTGRDPLGAHWAGLFQSRLHAAFRNALSTTAPQDPEGGSRLEGRCQTLVAQTLGVWLMVRMDPRTAAEACLSIVEEIARW
jgi:TetR/AcrR family transcriptional regulator, transcriptional repressor for nem operon